MESKLALADSTTQTTYTALYAAGQGGGGRPGRRCTPRRRIWASTHALMTRVYSLYNTLVACHASTFQLKDLGPLHYFLSIEVLHTSSSLLLHQSKYTEELLTRGGMAETKTAPTPMAVRPPSNLNNRLFDNSTLYQSIALKRILHYLKGSSRRGLLFQKGNQKLSIYSDSDWANGKDDRRSTTRYLLFLGPNLISWCTKKQTRDIFDEL
ncbi:uncharacterized mitochondrial protein AtMg00810-like [Solanum lycopersicum]|uniref:uncharacterized mitochondrial protein AtMg00810-like n=1 Tax=Solanum lycopersicum TaxID=4081 RepID=UPI0002BCB3FD|nr:uncharacterized protein LOC109120034 [Solanum lycopersicum]